MLLKSSAFEGGVIPDRFGGRGKEVIGPMYSRSIPFSIEDVPEGTVTFAVVFDDPDAMASQGIVWRHWLVSGLRKTTVPENASREDPDLVQGITSWYPKRVERALDSCFYGGPNPPDKPHVYVLTVYALDYDPGLKTGFTYESLMESVAGHELDRAVLKATYYPKSY